MANNNDAEGILGIYAPYVQNTAISFELEVPSIEDFRQRIAEVLDCYPYLVCEIDGKIVAYAYAHKYLSRAAYSWNAEFSVYVDREYCKHYHIGSALYMALKKLLILQNVQNVYGLVADSNEKSFALHKKIGFKKIATYSNVGYKFGKWHNVSIFEMHIGKHPESVAPILKTSELKRSDVDEILLKCEQIIDILKI